MKDSTNKVDKNTDISKLYIHPDLVLRYRQHGIYRSDSEAVRAYIVACVGKARATGRTYYASARRIAEDVGVAEKAVANAVRGGVIRRQGKRGQRRRKWIVNGINDGDEDSGQPSSNPDPQGLDFGFSGSDQGDHDLDFGFFSSDGGDPECSDRGDPTPQNGGIPQDTKEEDRREIDGTRPRACARESGALPSSHSGKHPVRQEDHARLFTDEELRGDSPLNEFPVESRPAFDASEVVPVASQSPTESLVRETWGRLAAAALPNAKVGLEGAADLAATLEGAGMCSANDVEAVLNEYLRTLREDASEYRRIGLGPVAKCAGKMIAWVIGRDPVALRLGLRCRNMCGRLPRRPRFSMKGIACLRWVFRKNWTRLLRRHQHSARP